MIKRLLWLTVGFSLGLWASFRATRAVRSSVERYVPAPVMARLRALDAAVEERRVEIRARKGE